MKRVSVIIPVYNAGAFLAPAVESILSQTWDALEVIVIDDGSTDGAVEQLKRDSHDPRLRFLCQPNRGKAAAVNRALGEIQGDYWTLQDADDLSYPERIARQVEALEARPELAAVYVWNDIRIGRHVIAPRTLPKSPEECRREIDAFRLPAHDATGMYRASLVGDFRFNEELRVGQGVDFVFRVGESHPIEVLPGCWYSHWVNRDSVTHSKPQNISAQMELVRRLACERRGVEWQPRPPKRVTLTRRIIDRLTPHRKVDTIVSYAVESVRHLRTQRLHHKAAHTALVTASLHPWDPLYYKPILRLILPEALFAKR